MVRRRPYRAARAERGHSGPVVEGERMPEAGSEDPPRIGEYQVLQRLGAGGMGVVYLARDPRGRAVAVKVIRREYAADPEFRRRFEREVRAARRVSGPAVAAVEAAHTSAEEPWLATEFVTGPSLAEAVGAHGPLPRHTWQRLAHGLVDALLSIHSAGIVHRDLKPSNVLMSLSGPRVIDFGIARGFDDTRLTRSGSVVGTPGYMAPEYVVHGRADERADLFALGAVLAFAATGRAPFGEGPAVTVTYRAVHEEPDLAGVRPDAAELIRSCLAKAPERRPPLQALAHHLRGAVPGAEEDWLPPAVVASIARRADELLRLAGTPGHHPPTLVVDPAGNAGPVAEDFHAAPTRTAERGGSPDRSASDFSGMTFSQLMDAFFGTAPDDRPGADIEVEIELTPREARDGHVAPVRLPGPGGGERTVTVRFPPGIRHGHRLRLAGHGVPGGGGVPDGDAYITVSLRRRLYGP